MNRMGSNGFFNLDGTDYGSEAAKAFWERNKKLLTACRELVDSYILEGNGDALLLLDASWLALAARVRDHLGRHGVEVKALPVPVAAEMCNIIK